MYIDGDYLPQGTILTDPSHIRQDDVTSILHHWYSRQEQGLPPLRFHRSIVRGRKSKGKQRMETRHDCQLSANEVQASDSDSDSTSTTGSIILQRPGGESIMSTKASEFIKANSSTKVTGSSKAPGVRKATRPLKSIATGQRTASGKGGQTKVSSKLVGPGLSSKLNTPGLKPQPAKKVRFNQSPVTSLEEETDHHPSPMRSRKVSEQASAIASGSNLMVAGTRVTEQIRPSQQATFTPSYMSVTRKLPQLPVLPLIPVSQVPDIESETGIMPTMSETGDDWGTGVSQRNHRSHKPRKIATQRWQVQSNGMVPVFIETLSDTT